MMFGRNKKQNNRDQDYNHNHDDSKSERPRLDWKEVEQIQYGFAVGAINSAERPDGSRIFSWCLGRIGRGRREGQTVKFLDPRDFLDAHKVLDEMEDWVNDEKAAEKGS
jgi:hypothetical protein